MVDLALRLISIPVLFILPGYVTFRVVLRDITERLTWAEALFIQALGSLSFTMISGFILAHAGLLSLPALCLVSIVYASSASFFFRPTAGLRTDHKETVAVCVIVCLNLLLLYFFPLPARERAESDIGPYAYGGISIAREGSMFVEADGLVDLREGVREDFIGTDWEAGNEILYFGFNYDRGRWTVYHSTINSIPFAVAWLLFEIDRPAPVLFLFGLLAAVGLFLLGKHLGGAAMGLVAAALLSCNLIHLFVSRMAVTDAVGMPFAISHLCLLVMGRSRRDGGLLALSALFYGLLLFTRPESLMYGMALLGYFFIKKYRHMLMRAEVTFVNVLGGVIVLFFFWGMFYAPEYIFH